MSHTKSVRPSSRASSGRAGHSLSIIFVMTTGVLKSPNGYLPVKTLNGIQTLDKPSIPASGISREDRPLSQPCQMQRCLLPACLYRLSQEPLARSTSQCFPVPEWKQECSTHQRPRPTQNPSNERVRRGQRECWASQRLLPRFETT